MNRILIVDDQQENLYFLQALLTASGFVVDEARHGAEALVKARQHLPDIIISDLLMPVMDGYTLLRHWKTDDQLQNIPFVVYTATYTEPNDEKLALDLGADAFIIKPAEPDQFMNRINEIFIAVQRKEHTTPHKQHKETTVLMKEYNEVLIRKLEEKMNQLERTNHALMQEISEHKSASEKLSKQFEELQRWENVTIDREERVIELKNEVNELLTLLGKKRKYRLDDESHDTIQH